MDTVLNLLRVVGVIFLALMILNVMILVHEWGHFLAARWRGLKIEKFQIWFGKPIWKKTWNGVQYGLGCIPAGGFVALPQMAPMEAIEGKSEDSAPHEPLPPIKPLDKIIVAFAGPLFSFLLAVLFSFIVWIVGRPIDEPENPTRIGYISPDGPAAKSGLQPGDIIKEIDGHRVNRWNGQVSSVKWAIVSSEGEDIVFTVDRGDQRLDFKVTPVRKDIFDSGEATAPKSGVRRAIDWVFGRPPLRQVGIVGPSSNRVAMVLENSPAAEAGLKVGDRVTALDGQPLHSPFELYQHIKNLGEAPLQLSVVRDGTPFEVTVRPRKPDKPAGATDPETGIGFGDERLARLHPTPVEQISDSLQAVKNLFAAIASPKSDISLTHMGGPVMIVRVYYTLISPETWLLIFWFSVVLNVNLAVLNLLPFPVLDGGHITMAIIEWIRRRPLSIRVLEYIQTACVLLVFAFFITVVLKDFGDIARDGGGKIEFLPRPGGAGQ